MNRPAHVAADGSVAMVDVGEKPITRRTAHARAFVRFPAAAADALRAATLPKGDAMVTAQLAGIMAAKQTGSLIPLAHPVPLDRVDVDLHWSEPTVVQIDAKAATSGRTGVEMEAMVAASIAALTLYDMCKSLDKGITIEAVSLVSKTGGKSGDYHAA